MRVLAIIGSPRKGHSYQVTQEIERRLTQNADLRFEYVFLGELNLQGCRGCYVCQSRGEQYCPLNDARADLVRRMQEATGVILVSPVYTGNVSGLMKSLMDRIAYTAHRPAFLGKPAMLVATGSSSTRNTLKALAWFRYTGFEIVSSLGVSVWPTPRLRWRTSKAVDKKFEKAVSRFEKALSHPPVSLSLAKVLQFYVMKTTPATDTEFFQADHEYHQSIDQLGFKVSRWKKALGHLCYWTVLKWIDRHLEPVDRGKNLSRDDP